MCRFDFKWCILRTYVRVHTYKHRHRHTYTHTHIHARADARTHVDIHIIYGDWNGVSGVVKET